MATRGLERLPALPEGTHGLVELAALLPAPVVLASAGSDAGILFANGAALALFGVSSDHVAEVDPQRLWADDHDRVRLMRALRKDGSAANVEAEMLNAAGESFWALISARLLGGEPPTIVFTLQDITPQRVARETITRLLQRIERSNEALERRVEDRTKELRQARDQAAETHEQMVEAIEAISEGFVLYDADDRFVLCNSRYRDEYSFAPELLVPGTPYADILRHGMAAGRVPKQYVPEHWIKERLANHRKPRPPYVVQRPDGRSVRMTEYRTHDGGIVGIRTDVTELIDRERQAEESRRLLRAVIDAVPAVINVKDRESRYLLMNRYQGELYGVDPHHAVGQTSSNFTGPTYGGQSRMLDLEVLDTGKPLPFTERDFVDVHGKRHTWFTAKLPLENKSGRVDGVVTVALDISTLKETERARANLSRYFAPNMLDMLIAADEPFGPARSQRVVVLFADIVGFTTLCETLRPEAVFDLLRAFQRRMAMAVFAVEGTVDKFIGDGMMATFGTPEPRPDDPLRALRCARAMQASIAELNRSRPRETPIRIAIGLHIGSALLGNIGSENRLEFAVVGDVVNVASRLEHLCRPLKAGIVVSADVVAAARQCPGGADSLLADFEERGAQDIPGRRERLRVWISPAAPS